ncbi:MAG: triple tyrosine motif-containing protein, partial [Bacteroidota bacterium]
MVGSYSGAKLLNTTTGQYNTIAKTHLLGLSTMGPDTLWGGTHGSLLACVHRKDLSITKKKILPGYNFQAQVPYFDTLSGWLFIGTNKGLIYSTDRGRSFSFYEKNNQFPIFQQAYIDCFHPVASGLLIGTSLGIFFLHYQKGIVEHYRFPNNLIKHIHEDADGVFWLSTGGGGLLRWELANNDIKQFTTDQGLSHNYLYAAHSDTIGHLWISSNQGIIRFRKRDHQVTNFLPEDGLTHEEFNTYSHFAAQDGRLFFGSLNGITAFHPDKLRYLESKTPIQVTNFHRSNTISGELLDETSQFLVDNYITLNQRNQFFTLEFALLDYAAQKKTYAWRIEALENNWNYQTENELRINGLPYGEHHLHVKAQGSGGQWTDDELIIPITVLRPYYLRWPFIISALLALNLLVFGWLRQRVWATQKRNLQLQLLVEDRTKALSQKNKELEALNRTKDRLFAILSHDLRTPIISLRGLAKKVSFLI